MDSEKANREKIVEFKNLFEQMGTLAHREGDWLKEYSRVLLNFLDLLDQLPMVSYGKEFDIAKIVLNTGNCLIELGDYFTAIDVFQRLSARCLAAKNFYQAGAAFNAMGLTYNQLNLFDKAEVSFGWALRINKKQLHDELGTTITLNNYAVSLIRIKRWSEAEKTFLEVLKRIKKFTDSEIRSYTSYSKMDLISSIYNNMGKLFLFMTSEAQEKRLPYRHFAEKACDTLNEAIEHNYDSGRRIVAESDFAEALFYLGKYKESERILRHLERKCFGHSESKRLLANIYRRISMIHLAKGEVDEAMDHCYRALETSLLFANPAEEMEVIDTFMDVLKMSSKILFKHIDDQIERTKIANSQGHKLIDNLVEFLEKKDLYTGLHHSFNVCQLSVRMGEIILENSAQFGISPDEKDPEKMIQLDLLSVAAMLHDIGKLQVPWAVINKILPLREEEWQLIKDHPVNGYRILDSFYLTEAGKIVIEHHEKVDGSGYPWGRKKLSLMGAIVALADVYEAMTTINRFYRQAKPKSIALAELKSLSGIHFDPRVVKAITMVVGSS